MYIYVYMCANDGYHSLIQFKDICKKQFGGMDLAIKFGMDTTGSHMKYTHIYIYIHVYTYIYLYYILYMI